MQNGQRSNMVPSTGRHAQDCCRYLSLKGTGPRVRAECTSVIGPGHLAITCRETKMREGNRDSPGHLSKPLKKTFVMLQQPRKPNCGATLATNWGLAVWKKTSRSPSHQFA